jgi:hypothetical protein
MEPADSIKRIGFTRWYERRLIEGHAWFVSCFFCMIAIAACMEELNVRGSLPRLLFYVVLVASSAAIGVYGFWRYQSILVEAETLGENATCPGCGTYARFRLVSATEVRCRRCENQWRLIVPD